MERVEADTLASRILDNWRSSNARDASVASSAAKRGIKSSPRNLNRTLVAIAGAPGSGKSTLASSLCDELNRTTSDTSSVVLPLDGFHFDNAVIQPMGLLPRKGSPETFDVAGFGSALKRVRALPAQSGADTVNTSGMDNTSGVAIPVFDRSQDLARAGAAMVTPQHQIVLVEGNYLLLKSEPWAQLRALFDLTVMLDVGLEQLKERLVDRWLENEHTRDEAVARVERNDLPNARTVIEHSVEADLVVTRF